MLIGQGGFSTSNDNNNNLPYWQFLSQPPAVTNIALCNM